MHAQCACNQKGRTGLRYSHLAGFSPEMWETIEDDSLVRLQAGYDREHIQENDHRPNPFSYLLVILDACALRMHPKTSSFATAKDGRFFWGRILVACVSRMHPKPVFLGCACIQKGVNRQGALAHR